MMSISKRKKLAIEKVDPARAYAIEDALSLVKELATAKFPESIDISVNLGVDPRKSDQVVRGSTVLPNGTGKSVRVAVFAQGEYADKAKICKLNTDDARDSAVEFGINAIPTIILFHNGQVVRKFVGITPKQEFAAELDKVAN